MKINFDLIVPRTKNGRKDQDEKKKAENAGPGYMGWQMKDNIEKLPENYYKELKRSI